MFYILMGGEFGLSDEFEYYEFSLDSLDADSAFTNSATSTDWPLFTVAGKGPLQDVVAIKVLEVQVPFSWYVINSANNTFLITEDDLGVPLTATVTIPIGNYSAVGMATALSASLTSATQVGSTYTVTYNNLLQKFEFVSSSNTNSFFFTFGAGFGLPGVQPNSGNRNPRLWIGFGPGASSTSTSISSFQRLTSPNVVLTSGPSYLYLNSQKLGSDVDVYLPQGAFNLGGGKSGPQIAKIPINVNPGGIIFWQDPDPEKWFKYTQLQTLNAFDFYLTLGNTTSENPLKLNGISFSLKLGIIRQLKMTTENVQPTTSNGRISRRQGPKRLRQQ